MIVHDSESATIYGDWVRVYVAPIVLQVARDLVSESPSGLEPTRTLVVPYQKIVVLMFTISRDEIYKLASTLSSALYFLCTLRRALRTLARAAGLGGPPSQRAVIHVSLRGGLYSQRPCTSLGTQRHWTLYTSTLPSLVFCTPRSLVIIAPRLTRSRLELLPCSFARCRAFSFLTFFLSHSCTCIYTTVRIGFRPC
jgi:hypothetical protein